MRHIVWGFFLLFSSVRTTQTAHWTTSLKVKRVIPGMAVTFFVAEKSPTYIFVSSMKLAPEIFKRHSLTLKYFS